jgi:hypothetical protein
MKVLFCRHRQLHSVEISGLQGVNLRTIKIMIKRQIIKSVIAAASAQIKQSVS